MKKIRDSLLCLLIVTYSISFASADLINGCGGFVEASSSLIKSRKPSDAKLDYSHVTVELRTVDGLVKESTQCAPNGYYLIPVYDKGSFRIQVRGPSGWSFKPDEVPVVVDENGCNGNEDINFRFTGFTLSGRVVGAVGGQSCSSKKGGPAKITVELFSSSGDVVSSVLTSSKGSYMFLNIIPGTYKIGASHPDMKVEVKGSTEVELGFENGVVDDIFFVPGYDIRGLVVAQGNPILGVHVNLYSDDVVEIECPQGSVDTHGQGKSLCHAVSDAYGMFTFKSIPCGMYKLIPYYKGENTVFDISPSVLSVSVEHQHVKVPQKFQVTGFSVGGRVIDGNGMGVEGVKIIVDGHERSVTDTDGYYKLDQVTSNRYTIEARKKHYKFNNLREYMVLPNKPSVPDIQAVSYDVCGVAHMVNPGYKAKVALTHGPENVKPQVKHTDDQGNFCFQVPAGEYRLSAMAATSESTPSLLFLPPSVDVVVKSPLLKIEFSQALININGAVVCKEKCGPSVSISLVNLAGKRNEEKKSVCLTDESNQYVFSNVLPGKYRLEVKLSSPEAKSSEDNWCWEQSFIDVDTGIEDVKGITFVQKGYWINIVSTHDVDAFMTQAEGSPVNLKIKKGSQRICVEHPGVHQLQFVDSCISFGSSLTKIDTSNPLPIYLKGEKYLLKGQINAQSSSSNDAFEFPENIVVDILNNGSDLTDGTVAKLVASNENDKENTGLYEYSVWASPGEKLTFVPSDARNNGEKILFYPRQHEVSVGNDGCQAPIPTFSGRPGLYIEGSVSPPLSDVHIRIIAAIDSQIASIKRGDIVLATVTGADGSFVGGPLYDDTSYSVDAYKPGYHLKRLGPHSFSCQKLGQISVNVFSKDNANEPIPSVLLSLSGDDGYRNNSISGAGGFFLFDNLFPGSFYLRPLLKEYAFSPPTLAIDLGSGESREVTFHATRVAYSATGTIALLAGQPKEGVCVKAWSESGFYEETVTDSSGNYRLRGLIPETTYVVRVAKKNGLGSSRVERASPESVTVKVGSEDTRGLDFVVFEQPEMTILSGHVEGTRIEELQSHILVEIKSAINPSKVESVFPLPLSNFFQVKDLPKGKHLLQLRYNQPSSTHRFESETIEVDLEKNAQIHVGPLRYKVEEDLHKQELTAAPVLPLVVGISVIALFISVPRLNDLYQATTGIQAPGFAVSTKKDVRKPAIRKKTY